MDLFRDYSTKKTRMGTKVSVWVPVALLAAIIGLMVTGAFGPIQG